VRRHPTLRRLRPFRLVNRHSGKCLTIQNASTENDALAIQFTCDSSAPFNERWFLDDLSPSDPYYHLVNNHSNRCLTIQNASTATDARALQFTCDFAPPFNEEWQLVDLRASDPYFHIVNRHSGKCLTIQNASFSNDARALQFPCDFSAPFNEEWQLIS
jgi:Ricin-type beta-trefoil lectin domain